MSNSIRETVQTALDRAGYGQYSTYAAPILAALEEREQGIADSIRDAADQAGLSDQADAILSEVGLPDRKVVEPEPLYDTGNVSTGFDMASLNDALERALRPIQDQVHRLTEAARSRGISV
jgi:2-hydroxychromene-2-carboxylate isomerase